MCDVGRAGIADHSGQVEKAAGSRGTRGLSSGSASPLPALPWVKGAPGWGEQMGDINCLGAALWAE